MSENPEGTHQEPVIADSARFGDDVRIGAGVVIGERVIIGNNVRIGAGAVIVDDVTIRSGACVVAESIVEADVAARAIVEGNPAGTVGFVGAEDWPPDGVVIPETPGAGIPIGDTGCRTLRLSDVRDRRGSLLPIELTADIPFQTRRLFFVHDVVAGGVRGQHAHRECDQLLFAVAGAVTVVLDDGMHSAQIHLDSPDLGVFLPAGIWVTHYRFSAGAVLAVLAENPYDPAETINDYDTYLRWRRAEVGS